MSRQMELGEAAKADGMARADNAASLLWAAICDECIARAAASGEVFDAYDLVTRWGCPEPKSPAAWGARLSANAKAGVIVAVGYGPSKRPTTARSAVRTWRGARCCNGHHFEGCTDGGPGCCARCPINPWEAA